MAVATALVALAFPVLMAVAAVSDLLTMTIPNRISLALVALFPVMALLAGLDWATAGLHVAVAAGLLAVTFTLFAVNIIGGGDAKLAAAAALWLGPSATLVFLFYAAIFGGALSLLLLFFRSLPLPVLAARQPWIERLHAPRGGVPYGIALAAGGLMAYPSAALFSALAG